MPTRKEVVTARKGEVAAHVHICAYRSAWARTARTAPPTTKLRGTVRRASCREQGNRLRTDTL
ncbi:hypothetical protein GCM10009654_16690 [Streptomyces hebeiensis]|uniref:Uncharacterized protein n=1 Tax=Streptomyces hebeiensis TaxID=229486 RepID=A0ABN1UNY4_9ACTN